MPYAIVLEFDGVDRDQYDAVNDKLGIDMATGAGSFPVGLVSHAAGPIPGGWLVSEIWDSKAEQQAFMAARLGTALATAGVPRPTRVTDSELVSLQTP